MSTERELEEQFLKKAYESLHEIPERDLFFEAFGRQFNTSAGWLELDPPRYPYASPPSQDSEEFITPDGIDEFKEYDNIPTDNLEHQTMSLEGFDPCPICHEQFEDLEEHTRMIHGGSQSKLFESEIDEEERDSFDEAPIMEWSMDSDTFERVHEENKEDESKAKEMMERHYTDCPYGPCDGYWEGSDGTQGDWKRDHIRKEHLEDVREDMDEYGVLTDEEHQEEFDIGDGKYEPRY